MYLQQGETSGRNHRNSEFLSSISDRFFLLLSLPPPQPSIFLQGRGLGDRAWRLVRALVDNARFVFFLFLFFGRT